MFCIKQSAVNQENPDSKNNDKPSTTLPGTVQKIIKSPNPDQSEQAEIVLPDAEPLYQEIRVENTLEDKQGEELGEAFEKDIPSAVPRFSARDGLRHDTLRIHGGEGSGANPSPPPADRRVGSLPVKP